MSAIPCRYFSCSVLRRCRVRRATSPHIIIMCSIIAPPGILLPKLCLEFIYYYDEFASYISPTGVTLQGEYQISPTPSSRADLQAVFPGFIGDYQDVWDDYFPTEQAVAAWIGIGVYPDVSTHNGDDCTTPITY